MGCKFSAEKSHSFHGSVEGYLLRSVDGWMVALTPILTKTNNLSLQEHHTQNFDSDSRPNY